MYRLVIDTRREGKLKGISGVWRSPEREKHKVITLGSILLILQILHVSLRIIVVIKQLTGRP